MCTLFLISLLTTYKQAGQTRGECFQEESHRHEHGQVRGCGQRHGHGRPRGRGQRYGTHIMSAQGSTEHGRTRGRHFGGVVMDLPQVGGRGAHRAHEYGGTVDAFQVGGHGHEQGCNTIQSCPNPHSNMPQMGTPPHTHIGGITQHFDGMRVGEQELGFVPPSHPPAGNPFMILPPIIPAPVPPPPPPPPIAPIFQLPIVPPPPPSVALNFQPPILAAPLPPDPVLPIARRVLNENTIEPHTLGHMDVLCPKCHAWHWDEEKTS